MTLDLAMRGRDRTLFRRLVATADFVLESFQPGYLDSLGLGYAALAEINPARHRHLDHPVRPDRPVCPVSRRPT